LLSQGVLDAVLARKQSAVETGASVM